MPKAKDVRELIFRGLSPRFHKGFVLAGTVVTWLGTYIFIRAMGNDSWPDFGISVGAVIAMIPLMFNVASYGTNPEVGARPVRRRMTQTVKK